MLDFRIDTFLAVCKYMNFTKASQYLNITQPAVSGHIRYLEEYYDVKLFMYIGKKMQLTKAGKILLDVATTLKHDDIFLKKITRKWPDYFKIAKAIKGSEELTIERWQPEYIDLISNKWEVTDDNLEVLKEHLKMKWWE